MLLPDVTFDLSICKFVNTMVAVIGQPDWYIQVAQLRNTAHSSTQLLGLSSSPVYGHYG